MGTRGLMGIRIDGEDKLMYNHFDSYPSGLGTEILTDLSIASLHGWDDMKEEARALRLIDENSTPTEADKKKFEKIADLGVSNQSLDDWYCLLRHLQGDLSATLKWGVMLDGNDFINDSLFCEWAYIINLDTMKLEVYKGFQDKEHDKGRYAKKDEDVPAKSSGVGKYFPCALLVEFDLKKLPEDADFVREINKAAGYDEEDEE